MRYLVCLAGGILLGALIAMTIANAMQRRNAWPRAAMTVMQQELGVAREQARSGRCEDVESKTAMAHLRLLATDPERMLLAPGEKDRVFSQYAADLRSKIAAASETGTDCKRAGEALGEVAGACDACHRDYR